MIYNTLSIFSDYRFFLVLSRAEFLEWPAAYPPAIPQLLLEQKPLTGEDEQKKFTRVPNYSSLLDYRQSNSFRNMTTWIRETDLHDGKMRNSQW